MSSTCKHCGRQRVGCQCPAEIEPKPLDPRHAHLALMAVPIYLEYSNREFTNAASDITDAVQRARQILAEVEAQEREGAK